MLKEEKKEKIRQSIELAKKELEELKKQNPNQEYEELEIFLQKMNDAINSNKRIGTSSFICKMLRFFLGAYLYEVVAFFAVFGFSTDLLNPISPLLYLLIIPLTAFVFYFSLRFLNFITNSFFNSSIAFMIIGSLVLVFIYAIADDMFIHICSGFNNSLVLSFVLMLVNTFTDIIYTKRYYSKIRL